MMQWNLSTTVNKATGTAKIDCLREMAVLLRVSLIGFYTLKQLF